MRGCGTAPWPGLEWHRWQSNGRVVGLPRTHLRAMTRTIAPFAEWEQLARVAVVGDPIWTVQAFRLATYAVQANRVDRENSPAFDSSCTVGQLTRSLGSVAANIAEGYSRASLAERQRFYGYALGSVIAQST